MKIIAMHLYDQHINVSILQWVFGHLITINQNRRIDRKDKLSSISAYMAIIYRGSFSILATSKSGMQKIASIPGVQ